MHATQTAVSSADRSSSTPIITDPRADVATEPGARVFVWTIWTAAFVGIIVYAAFFSTNIPWADEWSHVPVVTGDRPLSLAWLWELHNEHRIALPKLIWLASLRFSNYNFRLLPFLDICALGALAFVMILGAKK